MSGYDLKRWLSLAAVVAVAVMIFCFSAQEGEESAKLSDGVTEAVLTTTVPGYKTFPKVKKQEYRDRAGLMVRKAAHFSEYALLGLVLLGHLHYALAGRPMKRIVPAAWLGATLYAVTDELHQMFVADRGSAVLDVCIDSAGALTGALAGAGLLYLWYKYKKKSRLA